MLWASIAGVIAIGRWDLLASRADVPRGVLVLALGLLVPSAIINVIVLLKRPVKRTPPAGTTYAPVLR